MVKFKRVESRAEWELLSEKAGEVWREYFPCCLSREQIEYMIEKFQSLRAFEELAREGYEYYFIEVDGAVGGYMGIKLYSDRLYLSKFYILRDFRGRGYGRKSFDFLKEKARAAGVRKIALSVNKHNTSSITVYRKFGFRVVDAVVRDIGNGYVMDDFDCEADI